MDIIFWIILVVIIAAIILWLLNRKRTANPPGGPSAGTGTGGARTDGALEGGSAAASAQAAGTTGIPTAAGFGRPAEPAAPSTAEEPADSAAISGSGEREERRRQDEAADQAEWETQWSEAGAGSRSGSSATSGTATPPAPSAGAVFPETAAQQGAAAEAPAGQPSPTTARPVHHDEYTAPHAPTLPGAETAAVESSDDAGTPAAGTAGGQVPQHRADTSGSASAQGGASQPVSSGTAPAGADAAHGDAAALHGDAGAAETLERAQSSALVENGADHRQPSGPAAEFTQGPSGAPGQASAVPEPSGHLAANEPYGAGSAAPGPDGSGPEDYTVKGDAAAMVYYEEGHPDYEQTKAEVWFESAAHAEAAGFRAPRRRRL